MFLVVKTPLCFKVTLSAMGVEWEKVRGRCRAQDFF